MTEFPVLYQHGDENIFAATPLTSQWTLTVIASEIERERGRVHARLSLTLRHPTLGEKVVFWTRDNVESDEIRLRTANSAFKAFSDEAKEVMPALLLKRFLDEFCFGLWEAYLSNDAAEITGGDSEIVPIEYIIQPFIVRGGGTILFAPPGRGKSFCGQIAAVAVDAGLNGIFTTYQTPVLFVNLERSKRSLTRRLSAVNAALGLPRTRPLLMLNRRGRTLSDVYDAAEKAVKEHNVGLVVLDSLSRGGFGDLTENRDVNRAIDALNRLSESWLALAHTPRQDESHVFGGIHHEAGADIMVQLKSKSVEDEMGLQLEITKANDVRTGQQAYLALKFNADTLAEIRPASANEFPELKSGQLSLTEQIIDFILDSEGARSSATHIAQGLDMLKQRANISHILNNDPHFVVVERVNQSVFFGVKGSR